MKRLLLVIFTLVIWILSPATSVLAEPGSEAPAFAVEYDLPMGGMVSDGKWTELTVTLTNLGGDFDGLLELGEMYAGQEMLYPILRERIKIGEGEKQTIYLPTSSGGLLNNGGLQIVNEKGEVLQKEPLSKIEYQHNPVVVVLSNREEGYRFLSQLVPENSPPWSIRLLPTAELPERAMFLETMDMLVLDQPQALSLTEAQQTAIQDWVKLGGTLLLTGGELAPSIEKQWGLPVLENELFAQQSGKGRILAAELDPTQEEVALDARFLPTWKKWFKDNDIPNAILMHREVVLYHDGLMEQSLHIPGLERPSLAMITWLWTLFGLMIGPVLYFVLKKWDRREWTWFIAPAASIVVALLVFVIGQQQIAPEDTAYTVSRIEIMDETMAKAQYTTSILKRAGGDIEVVARPGVHLEARYTHTPRHERGSFSTRTEDGYTRIFLENVPYLTVKQIPSTEYVKDLGSFQGSLRIEGDRLKGEITNGTSASYDRWTIAVGPYVMEFGAIEPGETKPIDAPLTLKQIHDDRPPHKVAYEMSAKASVAYGYDTRPMNQMEAPVYYLEASSNDIAFPITPVTPFEATVSQASVIQSIPWKPAPDGTYSFPEGLLPISVDTAEGETRNHERGWAIRDGRVVFTLWPEPRGYEAVRVELALDEDGYKPFQLELYNYMKKTWEKVEKKRIVLEPGSPYLSQGGRIQLSASLTSEHWLELPNPKYSVTAKAVRP